MLDAVVADYVGEDGGVGGYVASGDGPEASSVIPAET